jgi:general stress protein 26
MSMRHEVRSEEIWFASSPEATKCRELEGDGRCALVFFDNPSGVTVSVSGAGEVIRDRKLLGSLWDAAWTRWFPEGPDPRSVVLIRVIPERVERHGPGAAQGEVLFSAARRTR